MRRLPNAQRALRIFPPNRLNERIGAGHERCPGGAAIRQALHGKLWPLMRHHDAVLGEKEKHTRRRGPQTGQEFHQPFKRHVQCHNSARARHTTAYRNPGPAQQREIIKRGDMHRSITRLQIPLRLAWCEASCCAPKHTKGLQSGIKEMPILACLSGQNLAQRKGALCRCAIGIFLRQGPDAHHLAQCAIRQAYRYNLNGGFMDQQCKHGGGIARGWIETLSERGEFRQNSGKRHDWPDQGARACGCRIGRLRQAPLCRGQRSACPCLPIGKHHSPKGKDEYNSEGRQDGNGKADA